LRALLPAVPFLLAFLATLAFDRGARRRGLEPPGFAAPARRALGLATLGTALALTSFAALGSFGAAPVDVDFAQVPKWSLFALHGVMVVASLGWYAAGYAGAGSSIAAQLGLRAARPGRELAVGVAFGVGAWLVVLVAAWLVAMLVAALGGDALLPKGPPEAVTWLAAQSLLLRTALALSAGVVEEIFFRGLLQPRVGLTVSTVLFALAHLSYGQPFMLVGVGLLSVLYGLLVQWRQSVWAAIAAHAVFDLVQLLIVVPTVLRELGGFLA
jgi:membrane protease YdiL (CAAX protease family)